MGFAILSIIIVSKAALASHKGYNPVLWIFTLGFVGLIALFVLPNVHTLEPEEMIAAQSRANLIGGVLTTMELVLTGSVLMAAF